MRRTLRRDGYPHTRIATLPLVTRNDGRGDDTDWSHLFYFRTYDRPELLEIPASEKRFFSRAGMTRGVFFFLRELRVLRGKQEFLPLVIHHEAHEGCMCKSKVCTVPLVARNDGEEVTSPTCHSRVAD